MSILCVLLPAALFSFLLMWRKHRSSEIYCVASQHNKALQSVYECICMYICMYACMCMYVCMYACVLLRNYMLHRTHAHGILYVYSSVCTHSCSCSHVPLLRFSLSLYILNARAHIFSLSTTVYTAHTFFSLSSVYTRTH